MADKLRVLQVTGSLRVGGLENVALNIFRFCDRNNYSFDYLVYGDTVEPLEEEVQNLGGRVFHIPYPHNGMMTYFREMKKIMRECGPYDVVHSHSLFNSGFVMLAAAQMKIPVRISHAHSDRRNTKTKLPRKIYNSCMQFLINRYSTVRFACSEGAGRYLYGSGFGEDVRLVKNGIDAEKFRPNKNLRQKIRKEFGFEENKIVLHVGRLAEVKNQKKIIDVFHHVCRADPSVRLLIAGDGELKEALQSQIDALGLDSAAILTGTRSDIPALLSAADAYIMPSLYEGVSLSLIEAQVSGIPCLVSSNAAAAETRLTDCLHILELTDSDEVWAKHLLGLLERSRVPDAAVQVIEKGYDLSDIIKNVLQFYGE